MVVDVMTPPAATPTRVRHKVVAMATALAMITYLDRVCIAKLAPDIMRDLDLSKIQMGYVFSSFALAYTFFEIPTAWWADRSGTRTVLTRIVIWWSCFTAATAAATSYGALLILRFLFGAGEAGAWPCVARTFSRWIPTQERGTVQGCSSPGRISSVGSPRRSFVLLLPFHELARHLRLFGSAWVCLGVGLAVWFRDDPSEHDAVSAAEVKRTSSRTGRRTSGTSSAWATGGGSCGIGTSWRSASCTRRTA